MNSKDIHSAGNISISLGILAWNEESNIARTIESIFQQSIFDRWNHLFRKIEIICVANGCTDDTANVARKALSTLDSPKCHVAVVSLEQPGNANAWNNYIHRFSDQSADIVFLLDADIELLHPDTGLLKKMPDAAHVFEAYTGVRDIFNNQVRQATNVVILGFIIDELKILKEQNKQADLGEIIYSLNINDSRWVSKIVSTKINESGYFTVSSFYFFARLKKFNVISGVFEKLLATPVITIGFLVDLLVYSIANRKIKNLSYNDAWKGTKNKHI